MIVLVPVTPVVEPPAPPPPPLPPPATFALRWTWTAPWLGQTYDLTNLASPVRKLRGAFGTGQVDPEHWLTSAAALDGATWDGIHVGPGELFVPTYVTGLGSADFLANHDAFKRFLNPRKASVVRITRPDGQWREALCRYKTGGDAELTLDAVLACRAKYPLTWVRPDPYWLGDPVVVRFEHDGTTDSPPGSEPGGPDFVFAATKVLGSSEVTNPGDENAYPIYTISAPFTSFQVGIGEGLVKMTLTKTTGYIEVDTTPGVKTILDETGADMADIVTDVAMSSIPPGDTTVTTKLIGASSGSAVEVSFTPRYWSAW